MPSTTLARPAPTTRPSSYVKAARDGEHLTDLMSRGMLVAIDRLPALLTPRILEIAMHNFAILCADAGTVLDETMIAALPRRQRAAIGPAVEAYTAMGGSVVSGVLRAADTVHSRPIGTGTVAESALAALTETATVLVDRHSAGSGRLARGVASGDESRTFARLFGASVDWTLRGFQASYGPVAEDLSRKRADAAADLALSTGTVPVLIEVDTAASHHYQDRPGPTAFAREVNTDPVKNAAVHANPAAALLRIDAEAFTRLDRRDTRQVVDAFADAVGRCSTSTDGTAVTWAGNVHDPALTLCPPNLRWTRLPSRDSLPGSLFQLVTI